MATTPFPWQPGPDAELSDIVCLNTGYGLDVYAWGFEEAGEALTELVTSGQAAQDMLVYPVVFNLRHAVELMLKHVIQEARRLLDDPVDFPDGHRLDHLWNTCKPLLKRIWRQDPAFRVVERVVIQLCVIDPDGESFRYPVGPKKKRQNGQRQATVDPNLRYLDLRALHDDVAEALSYLDGADTGISVYLERRADMAAEKAAIEAEMRGWL